MTPESNYASSTNAYMNPMNAYSTPENTVNSSQRNYSNPQTTYPRPQNPHPASNKLLTSEATYLASTDQNIVTEPAARIKSLNYHLINESAKWTIVTAASEERVFAPLLPLRVSGVAPFPIVKKASMSLIDGKYVVELVGSDLKHPKFQSPVTVWFGCCRTKNTVVK